MSSDRPNQTVADYVALVISPALIMGLVSSLVFFLIEVFYRADGDWKGRLQWITFFFVFGAVLVARMSMLGAGGGRSRLYGPVLAFLTYLGMQIFVEYPEGSGLKELSFLINLLLVGLVWWCADRITWDCTNIDEDTDLSGEGLLQAAGLEEAQQPGEKDGDEELAEGEKDGKKLSWWARFQRYREAKNKRRTLGVWVVYFSLAALPLFGLGQSLIPLTSPGRRQFAFWLMTVYVACGLGLLMTTSFLSLRRYLRQRRLQMPAAMTTTWLSVGGGLIAVLLLVGALLPRPYPEYPLWDMVGGRSAKRKASEYAMKGGPHGEGKGRPGEARPEGKQPGDATKPGKGEAKGEGEKGGSGDKQGEKSGQGDKQGEKDGSGEKKGEKGGDGDKQGEKQGEKGDKQGEKNEKGGKPGQANAAKGMKEAHDKAEQSSGTKSGTNRTQAALQRVSQFIGRLAPVVKWIVFAILIVVVVFFVLRGGLQFLANFTDWARRLLEAWRNFWANLFGGSKEERAAEGQAEEREAERERELPFANFANPFETGAADDWTAQELVRYTFAAVQAWAREHDLGRKPGETAQEFAERVAAEVPALEEALRRLTGLYARAVYARGGMPGNTGEVVEAFWERLERVVEQPMSA